MAAKSSCRRALGAFVLLAATAGCAGAERLLPPGFVKYEDLARGQPPSPEIQARIAARKSAGEGGFPDLSAQPTARPQIAPATQRAATAAELEAARDALNSDVASDRAVSDAERDQRFTLSGDKEERALEEIPDALAEAIAKDEAAIARERGAPPRRPAPDDE